MPVNECDEFCCLFSATLNGKRILYGAEMDGIESDRLLDLNAIDLNRCNFIELKVKLREQNARQRQNYQRFKLRNWWCQCFLVNIRKVIVGTRTQDGRIDELTEMHVKDFPKQCQVRPIFEIVFDLAKFNWYFLLFIQHRNSGHHPFAWNFVTNSYN